MVYYNQSIWVLIKPQCFLSSHSLYHHPHYVCISIWRRCMIHQEKNKLQSAYVVVFERGARDGGCTTCFSYHSGCCKYQDTGQFQLLGISTDYYQDLEEFCGVEDLYSSLILHYFSGQQSCVLSFWILHGDLGILQAL